MYLLMTSIKINTLKRKLNDTLEKVLEESLKLFPSEERFKLNKLRLTNGNFIIELANNALIKATALFDKK